MVERRGLRFRAGMGTMEHRRVFELLPTVLPVTPVLDAESILQVTLHPHLPDDVLVQWEVRRRHPLDDEARRWSPHVSKSR